RPGSSRRYLPTAARAPSSVVAVLQGSPTCAEILRRVDRFEELLWIFDFGILSAFGFRNSDFMKPNRRISMMRNCWPGCTIIALLPSRKWAVFAIAIRQNVD